MAIKNLNRDTFYQTLESETKPVIVDFYADWCGPCKMMHPVLEELAAEHSEIAFYKVNVDENADIAGKYSVMSIPAFACFKNGQHQTSAVGTKSKQDLLDLVK